ncbi:MAG: MFS transporter [Burkholderiaceae bacterium]
MQTPAGFNSASASGDLDGPDSRYAWWRLFVVVIIMTVGSAGMWVLGVGLPPQQADFGIDRSTASMPYTAMMLGFGAGGILMGRLADRFGITVPVVMGAIGLGAGFLAAGWVTHHGTFILVHGFLIGLLGVSCTFSPLMSDTTLWFDRRRGIAVAICASGNYLGGALWPPIAQHFIELHGWRTTYMGLGLVCMCTMLPLAFFLRRRPPVLSLGLAAAGAGSTAAAASSPGASAATVGRAHSAAGPSASPSASHSSFARPFGHSPNQVTALLVVAGIGCCVAMAMPQVHIVAYCADLGYGAARGAEMLALMLASGIISRLVSGWIADRIRGLKTLMLGSLLQCVALLLFLPFDGLVSLYVVSALFGLFQGGIVPSYALVIREYFAPNQTGTRVAIVVSATMLGMALGGWMSGLIYDFTGSYKAAFVNGIGFNLLNGCIAAYLLWRSGSGPLQGLRKPKPVSPGRPAAA